MLLPLALLLGIASGRVPLVSPGTSGQLLGLALLAALLARTGWPDDAPATVAMRLGRVALAFVFYLSGKSGSQALLHLFGESEVVRLSLAVATTVLVLGASVWLARRLRLYPAA